MKPIISKVPGYAGLCKPTWLNKNIITRRLTGETTGFFRIVTKRFGLWWKRGEEFHGKLSWNEIEGVHVVSTKVEAAIPVDINDCVTSF